MTKRLMVIGGNPFQSPLARIGKQREYEVLLIDKNPDCDGRKYADRFEPISLADKEEALECAFEFRPDGVCTAGTDFTTTVGWICEGLGLPVNRFVSYETALEMSNKYLMREVLKAEDICQPEPYHLWPSKNRSAIEIPTPSVPAIVKPCQSMGARGVKICWTPNEVRDWVPQAQAGDPKGEAIIEPYIAADKFLSIDSMWLDGRLVFLSIADRLIKNFGPEGEFKVFPVELGHDVPADLNYAEYRSVQRIMCRVARAFCFRTGFIKGDLMLTKGKEWSTPQTYVGEIAARVSGSFNSGRTVPLATGFPLHDAVVDICMGIEDLSGPIYQIGVDSRFYASERTLVAKKAGKIKRISIDNSSQNYDTMYIWANEGDEVRPPTTNMDKLANVVACGKTREEAQKKAEKGLKEIHVELE